MKRLFLLFFCVLLLVGCKNKPAEIPVEDTLELVAADNVDAIFGTSWMSAYVDFLKIDSLQYEINPDNGSRCYNCWGVAYIDNDTIPELVLMCGCEACGKVILSSYEGRVSIWYSCRNGVDIVPEKGLIRNNDGSMGHYYDRYIRLERGVFTEYLTNEVSEYRVEDCFTIYNSDTVASDVLEREVQKFESLSHITLDEVASYPIDILFEYMRRK